MQRAYIFFNLMYLDSYRTPLDNHHKQVLLSKCACNISITTRLDMLYFCSNKVRSKETPIGSVLGDVTVVFRPGLHAKLFQ